MNADTEFTPQVVLNRSYDNSKKAVNISPDRPMTKVYTYTGSQLTRIDTTEADGTIYRKTITYSGSNLNTVTINKL
jgi:hypothetical protein